MNFYLSFYFATCPSGTWGDNCQERCNCAGRQEICNHVNGSCRCETGYGGVDCNIVRSVQINIGRNGLALEQI